MKNYFTEIKAVAYENGYMAALHRVKQEIDKVEYDGAYCKVIHSCELLDAIDYLLEVSRLNIEDLVENSEKFGETNGS